MVMANATTYDIIPVQTMAKTKVKYRRAFRCRQFGTVDHRINVIGQRKIYSTLEYPSQDQGERMFSLEDQK